MFDVESKIKQFWQNLATFLLQQCLAFFFVRKRSRQRIAAAEVPVHLVAHVAVAKTEKLKHSIQTKIEKRRENHPESNRSIIVIKKMVGVLL